MKFCNEYKKLYLLNFFRTLWKLTKDIYIKEGIIRGFYKGITLNIIKVIFILLFINNLNYTIKKKQAPLSSGTAWTVKNSLNRYLDKKYDL